MTQPHLQFTSWAFCLWTELPSPKDSLICLALSVQISIPKNKEIPGQFLLLAKHINKTYIYFNLLLIISAVD